MKKATFRLVGHGAEVGNSLDTSDSDVVDDGVGDASLKSSNIRQSVCELGSLQVQGIGASIAMVSIYHHPCNVGWMAQDDRRRNQHVERCNSSSRIGS